MGYGTLQEARAFSDGTAVEISVAKIVPANPSSDYNEVGIRPDFIVEYSGVPEANPANHADTYDAQYKKAVEVLISAASTDENQ